MTIHSLLNIQTQYWEIPEGNRKLGTSVAKFTCRACDDTEALAVGFCRHPEAFLSARQELYSLNPRGTPGTCSCTT